MSEPIFELRLGDWREVMLDVKCDALITDPPYSARTDEGYRTNPGGLGDVKAKMTYEPITRADAVELALSWHTRVKKWAVIFGDHVSWTWHEEAWKAVDWYTYQPVPWCRSGAAPRFDGRGPCSANDWILVARARSFPQGGWATPGHYNADTPRGAEKRALLSGETFVGAKDLESMRALVRDYTRPGFTVADCYAGTATTIAACLAEGVSCIASERDPRHHGIAMKRLSKGYTPELFPRAEAA